MTVRYSRVADTLKKAGAGKILERLYGSGAAAPGK